MKKVKIFIRKSVCRSGGKWVRTWKTSFTIGVQTFTIDNIQPRTKAEAKWYAKVLRVAFKNLIES